MSYWGTADLTEHNSLIFQFPLDFSQLPWCSSTKWLWLACIVSCCMSCTIPVQESSQIFLMLESLEKCILLPNSSWGSDSLVISSQPSAGGFLDKVFNFCVLLCTHLYSDVSFDILRSCRMLCRVVAPVTDTWFFLCLTRLQSWLTNK